MSGWSFTVYPRTRIRTRIGVIFISICIPRTVRIIPKRDIVVVHECCGITLSRPPREYALLNIAIVELIVSKQDTVPVRRRSFLDGELFRAPHRPLVDEPANGHADDEAEEDAQVVDDAGAEGHVVVLGELRQPVADEDVDEELRRRKGGGEREVPRGDARDRGQEAVAQAEGQGTEADGGQHEQAVVAQDVAQGDEPAVLAHEPLHVAAEHGAAGEERGRRPDDGGGRHDEPAARKAEDEARDGHRRAVPDQRRERRRGRQQEQQRPAPGQVPPALGHGVQGREDAVREHEEQDRHYQDHGPERPGQNALQGRHAVAQLHQLVRYRDAALHEAVAQRPVLLVGAGAAPRVRRREPPHAWWTGFAEDIGRPGPWREVVVGGGRVVWRWRWRWR